jgi:ketosteroid isomerase-like protein
MTSTVAEVVRRYYGTVADLGSTEDELRALMTDGARIVEHPNAITPGGADRGIEETVRGFLAGKALLADQSFEVEDILVVGDRAAVRATWTGTVGLENPRIPVGTRLVAHIAAFVTVVDGRVARLETFDCYEPMGSASGPDV